MKENMKIRGQLRTYLQWPIILSVFLLAANLAVGIVSPAAGLVMSGFTVIYVLVALWLFMYRRKRLMGGLVEFSAEYAWVQKQLLYEMAVPYAIADTEGHFLWLNHSFSEIVGEDKNCRKNIAAVFPELTRDRYPAGGAQRDGRYEAWCGGRGQRRDAFSSVSLR